MEGTAVAVFAGLAHVAVCVPDVDAATQWYESALGMQVLSPPYRMEGDAIAADMGELIPPPVVVKAAIVGLAPDDHVIELIEYPEAEGRSHSRQMPDHGISHIGLLCDDVVATRQVLEERGVEFLTEGIADVSGLRTTWFQDPWGTVFILLEKRRAERPYWQQWSAR